MLHKQAEASHFSEITQQGSPSFITNYLISEVLNVDPKFVTLGGPI